MTARGNERRPIYRGDRDRGQFCQLLGEAVDVFGWKLHAQTRQGLAESPWKKLTAQTVLGGLEFVRRIQAALPADTRELSRGRELGRRPKIAEIISAVEKVKGERWETFRDRHGDWGRDLALYLGKRGYGIKLKELGAAAGGMDYMSVSAAVKRLEPRAGKDAALAAALQRCRKELQM